MAKNKEEYIRQVLALGLDAEDGHIRISRDDDFRTLMGSEKTHEEISDWFRKLNKFIKKRELRLQDLSREEFLALVREMEGGE